MHKILVSKQTCFITLPVILSFYGKGFLSECFLTQKQATLIICIF